MPGDWIEQLRTLPDESVHCVITSPPYWSLRDYKTDGQLGLEKTPEEHVAKLVEGFREVRRVMRKDGTLWLNYADAYAGSGKGIGSEPDPKWAGARNDESKHKTDWSQINLKPKDLIGLPWRVAFALQADGWWLRQDIIWAKPNPMPESVTDRCTKSHEYVFLLTKSARYYADMYAIREPAQEHKGRVLENRNSGTGQARGFDGRPDRQGNFEPHFNGNGRNARSVWTIATEPTAEAHFATFPQKLVERCLLAGTSEKGACAKCGRQWERILERTPAIIRRTSRVDSLGDKGATRCDGTMTQAPDQKSLGFRPACECNAEVVPSTVLDPFFGSGTVGLVALRAGRRYIGIELNPDYIAIAQRRLAPLEEQGRMI